MGCDFRRTCQVQTRRFLWLIGLVLASVVIIQYFELPYRDSLLSLISTGKAYFSFSDANGNKEEHLPPKNNSSRPVPKFDAGIVSPENITSENNTRTNDRSEVDRIETISIAPASTNDVQYNFSSQNGIADVSPFSSQVASIVSISDMNKMLLHSRASSFSKSPKWLSPADEELLAARFEIEHANTTRDHPSLYAPIYQNLSRFARSYEIMEQKLKVYIYKEGDGPIFHQQKLIGIYASEGWFIKLLESSNHFVTNNSRKAHLFYLPFSSVMLVKYVYVKDSHTYDDINEYLKNYLDTIKANYPFWNRTDGSDHFVVACHDWGAIETKQLMANCIRVLCNSDAKQGFQFGKDVSLPQTKIHSPEHPVEEIGGMPPSDRKFLAFFAGKMHGYLRPVLLKYWENKDPDMKIVGRMRHGYTLHMKNSKYCICAKGFEVNSPRVVEAIMFGCVPVIISDNFVPPFFEILNWDAFAVFVLEKDIPDLKNILLSISEERYLEMQKRVELARHHFLWHNKPVKYDVFHMILHSIWYKRVFMLKPR